MTERKTNIGLVTFPIEKSGVVPLNNLLVILLEVTDGYIYSISGNRADELSINNPRLQVQCLSHQKGKGLLSRVKNYCATQIRIAYNMLIIRHNVDTWYFYFGGELLVLPLAIGKLTRKPVLLYLPNSCVNDARAKKSKFFLITLLVSKLNCYLADKLIVYSKHLFKSWNLEPYQQKTLIAHEHFLDFNTFTFTTPLIDRQSTIGYIGRLSGEKGVQNFIQSLPTLFNEREDLRVLIGGDGQLKETICAFLQEKMLTDRLDLPGWIAHDNLPKYLNQLRLLVLPSYSEGLPNIILEAMACGTPVLATPVGAIPDIITDGKTGFIMEDNSPKCITENIIRALTSPDMELIAENGRQFVEENFTFKSTVTQWKEVIEGLSWDK